ncbi:MAG: PqqD family protein [Chromatiaceae bacterium]
MIDDTTIYQLRPDIRLRNVGEEGVVLRQAAGEVLVLNGTGIRVLEAVNAVRPVSDIIQALAAEYEVGPLQLTHDVKEYLQELFDAQIIAECAEAIESG